MKKLLFNLINPASYFVSKYGIKDEEAMMLRMTINISYYTAVVTIYFLITY